MSSLTPDDRRMVRALRSHRLIACRSDAHCHGTDPHSSTRCRVADAAPAGRGRQPRIRTLEHGQDPDVGMRPFLACRIRGWVGVAPFAIALLPTLFETAVAAGTLTTRNDRLRRDDGSRAYDDDMCAIRPQYP